MKDFFFYIKQRIGIDKTINKIYILILVYIKTFVKIDFKIVNFDETAIDVIIPTISKDYEILELVIKSLNNVKQKINKIYIISNEGEDIINFCSKNNCIFINESKVLGYKKDSIKYRVNGIDRSGWIYQQLLKLSGDKITEKENYLVVDSDTVFVSKNSFIENKRFIFFQNKEWHENYFTTFKKLFGYNTKNNLSFTSHMMIFNKQFLKEIKEELEKIHCIKWDTAYLNTINNKEASCVSDYDTYANWVLIHHPDNILEKPLYNKSLSREKLTTSENLEKKYGRKYKTISFHSYIK